MNDAYQILGLDRDSASDDKVQAAWLAELHKHPPERDPEGFQRVRDAYEQIRTRRQRLAYALFHHVNPTASDLAARLLEPGPPRRPSADQIRRALAAHHKLR